MKTLRVKDHKQVAVRLTKDQWRKVSHFLADNDQYSFQSLVLELLDGKIGIKNSA